MANVGLVVCGALITLFSLGLLNPLFKIPNLGEFQGPLLAIDSSSIEWTVAAILTFVVVFLTGSVMMAKGFLERKITKSQTQYGLESTQVAA